MAIYRVKRFSELDKSFYNDLENKVRVGNQFYLILPYTLENILRYKSKDNLLNHARFIKGLSKGCFLVTLKEKDLVGYIGIEDNKIIALEVNSKYRNKGIATWLINNSGCDELTVNKNNTNAYKLYLKLGFKVKEDLGRMYLMKRKM